MKRRLLVAVVLAVFSSSAAASETKWWVLDTAADLLKGRGEGVAVTQEGMLKPVARWSRRVSLDEPIAAAVVEIGENELVVGTGFPARLYHVTPSGKQ
ncbi:MAG: hypothetical protein GY906_21840, partial [bacterium]|nr:hypothetical protein [bacterium]